MKKLFLVVFVVFAFGFTNAQKTTFGIKAGLNIANFTGDTGSLGSVSSRMGFVGGGFCEIDLGSKFTLQPELLYSSQGTKSQMVVNLDGTDYDVTTKIKLSYINVPIIVKYYPDKKFSLQFGPQIGFLSSANADVTVLGTTVGVDVKDSFESIDVGMNVGAGYDFTKYISADFRFNLGLANVAKTSPGDNTKLRNSVISISVVYKFPYLSK